MEQRKVSLTFEGSPIRHRYSQMPIYRLERFRISGDFAQGVRRILARHEEAPCDG